MCGIVGYAGNKPILSVLFNGLEQMEYRGYDSAGITIATPNGFKRIRSAGPLSSLKKKVSALANLHSRLGMGHTRWATHGTPTENNAHPQQSGKIQIVHNGIIENAQPLKKKFNTPYESQTDTEVIVKCIDDFYSQNSDFLQSIIQTNQLLKGSYSFLSVCDNDTDQIIGCKNGPPLIVGIGEQKEFFISSDLPSILQWTSNVYILNDKEMFSIQNGQCQFMDWNGSLIEKTTTHIKQTEQKADKKGYPHYMLKEIYDQPASIQNTLKHYLGESQQIKNLDTTAIHKANHLSIIACGSSYYAALYGKYVIEYLARIPVRAALASEFQYQSPILKKNDPFLFISQSGETADILSAFRKSKEESTMGLSLCNVKNSSLDRISDVSFYMHAGKELAVASTKAFTSTLVTLIILALDLAQKKQIQSASVSETMNQIRQLPSLVNQVLSQNQNIQTLSKSLEKFRSFLFLGRGPHFPIALEGALKIKELAYIHAEGYPSGEMKHGPLALVDDNVLVIGLIPKDHYYDKNLLNLEEAKARSGKILTLGSDSHEELQNLSLHHIRIPSAPLMLSGILEVVALQLLAYHFANGLGYDVDRPRNLAKSVTVE